MVRVVQRIREFFAAFKPFTAEEQRALEIGDGLMRGEVIVADEDDMRVAGFIDREVTLNELQAAIPRTYFAKQFLGFGGP